MKSVTACLQSRAFVGLTDIGSITKHWYYRFHFLTPAIQIF